MPTDPYGDGGDECRRALQAVADTERRYDAAWTRGDLPAILDCLAEDALLVSPRGDAARGHAEIAALLRDFMRDEARDSGHTSSLLRIELVGEDVAVVDGEAVISGSSGGVVLRHGFTDVLVKRDGEWRIQHIRAYALPEQ